MKFKRVFVIVLDSLGVGNGLNAESYGDLGSNTLEHIVIGYPSIKMPNLIKLGYGDYTNKLNKVNHPHSYTLVAQEYSLGKDTLTGHWEMMGINTQKPFVTFTDTGFPKELIEELEKRTGYKYIGNKAASGTVIIDELGPEQLKDKSLIIYTSADSVLQIAASEEVIGLDNLYKVCQIAREVCNKPEWNVARIIARPYVGKKVGEFKRTANRHDYAVSPTSITALDVLKDNGYEVRAVGKINDIFAGQGITKSTRNTSDSNGMDNTINEAKEDFKGLVFTNLVDFDAKFGHRRDLVGYAKNIEEFDVKLGELLPLLNDDDLLILTADHGNDPTWSGSDHTRENIPITLYSKSFTNGKNLGLTNTFGDIGATILDNFNLDKPKFLLGKPINTEK